jgi:asparagine synthase (glutamine-hydrolysing)
MCGFAGILTARGDSYEALQGTAARMARTLAHRGPDDLGVWCDASRGIALGFRRLAIIDVSELGHQPMTSASGRFTLVFNGEIYNYRELRSVLERDGHRFRGGSDTEVILTACERWGVEAAVRRFSGMFAIALWDHREQTLTLIRDRLGIKPLFIHRAPGVVTFGSELKALLAGPAFERAVDPDALVDYLRLLYVPGPGSIFRNTWKLQPGHLLTIHEPLEPLPEARPYWSLADVALAGLSSPFNGSDLEAVDTLDLALRESIRLHMHADVPLGALLSGGIDSATVTALLQEQSTRPVRTFSVGFDHREHDEAPHAARIAAHLGTDHTEVMLTGADALDVVPRLGEVYDEPHADAGQIPALLVCGVARRQVTVALSGDGGDELFAGYNRYVHGERLLRQLSRVPRVSRALLAVGIESISPEWWERVHRWGAARVNGEPRQRLVGEKVRKIGALLRCGSEAAMYRSLVSAWQAPEMLLGRSAMADDPVSRCMRLASPERLLDRMMLTDQLTYLVDDQMPKVDRASMAVGLELRVPLLSHELVELAWTFPAGLRIRNGEGKWPLRQVLYRRVPKALLDRPKVGFTVPLAAWLRGPLRPWAEDLLTPEAVTTDGLLEARPIRAAWATLKAGGDHLALPIWSVLVYQMWRERWLT